MKSLQKETNPEERKRYAEESRALNLLLAKVDNGWLKVYDELGRLLVTFRVFRFRQAVRGVAAMQPVEDSKAIADGVPALLQFCDARGDELFSVPFSEDPETNRIYAGKLTNFRSVSVDYDEVFGDRRRKKLAPIDPLEALASAGLDLEKLERALG